MHPDVLKKAREEILQVLGSEGVPTIESMRKLKYGKFRTVHKHTEKSSSLDDSTLNPPVRAVMSETLRLFPPAPIAIRDAREGAILPPSDPTYNSPPMYIPPGMPILLAYYLKQRNTALWGPDAEEFKPERWLDEELQRKIAANPAIYTPFGCGPRNVSDPPRPVCRLGRKLNKGYSVLVRTTP